MDFNFTSFNLNLIVSYKILIGPRIYNISVF